MNKKNKPLFTPTENKSIKSLSAVLFFRMYGIFLVFPIFSILASDLEGATPQTIGFALGAYGLTQACLQIPFGIWSDRVGRIKMLLIGLSLFAAGSLLGALATNIYVMIAARLIQGTGAVSAVVFALIADLTRPEVRTRATAALGASIGMAFSLAFFSAPFLGSWFSLNGIFAIITVSVFACIGIVWMWVPEPEVHVIPPKSRRQMIKDVLQISSLRTINVGSFLNGMGLSATFFIMPRVLENEGWERAELWKVYLPMLLLGAAVMIPSAIFAEVKHRFKEVMLIGAVFVLVSFVIFALGQAELNFSLALAAAFIFFMGFNVFEPIFPSLVTKLSTPETKGTASGIYNFCQFMGHFVGASLAGLFYLSQPVLLFGGFAIIGGYFLWRIPKLELSFSPKP